MRWPPATARRPPSVFRVQQAKSGQPVDTYPARLTTRELPDLLLSHVNARTYHRTGTPPRVWAESLASLRHTYRIGSGSAVCSAGTDTRVLCTDGARLHNRRGELAVHYSRRGWCSGASSSRRSTWLEIFSNVVICWRVSWLKNSCRTVSTCPGAAVSIALLPALVRIT